MSQSLLASHGGVIAGLNGCTKGCMSVEEMSCFSYHVAVGNTMSEYSDDPFLRKSIVVSRSSLPSGDSRHVTSSGRIPSGDSSALTVASGTPSRCFRKNSWPLLDEPSKLQRQRVRTRGKFSGASGSSAAKRKRLSLS